MAVSESVKAKVIETINDTKDLSIKKMEGKTKVYIFAETSGLRVDARNSLTAALKKQKIATEEKLSRKSTELATFIKNQDIVVVYKNKSGGMQESTLNASITELFPIIAFDKKIPEKLTEQKFYTEIQKAYDPKSKVFLGTNDNKQGKKFIDDAVHSSKFKEKIINAKAALGYINQQAKGKPIKQVYWGYRKKPNGVNPSHRGDIFIEYTDGKMVGLSVKAGGAGTKEPKYNTYVSVVMKEGYKDEATYQKWQKESYDQYYKKVPNIPKFSFYGREQMVAAVANLEVNDSKYYNELYDEQLDWLRGKLIAYMLKNPEKTKKWLLNDVAAVDNKVPTLLLKLQGDKATVEDDENILAECVQRSKKGADGLSIEKSKTSKQNIIVTLTCRDHDTHFEFAVRTNQVGINHKLGQFIRLAFKYNGVVKKK
tara:strand:- start:42 stop:1319 length:1278 start_codon:yes stop_codon:yes gene_type:complete